jgi:hypothetical protein
MNRQFQDLDSALSAAMVGLAHIFSNVVSPPTICVVLGFSLAWVDLPFWPGFAWAALYAFLACLVPVCVVLYLLKTGRVSDLHMRNKSERHIPYLIGLICAATVLIIIVLFDGPQLLRYLTVCNIIGLATMGFINVYWLISGHTATIMLATVFVGFVFGAAASIALIPLIGLIFLTRLLLKRHTVAQLIAGLFVGAAPVLILANLGYIH